MAVHGFAAPAAKALLTPFTYEPGPLPADQIDIRVTHCGICHSDACMVDNDWGISSYPFVPGHEAVGVVEAIGSAVVEVKVGDRVGLGWQAGSCLSCDYCRSGREHLCQTAPVATIVGRHGGFADHVRCQARWAVRIPEALDSASAGPLMCAGSTVFTPLRHFGVQPGMRTAVVGIGGLGHLAVQFLAKWGCDVTAISSTRAKEAEARGFGATDFIATKDSEELKKAAGRFDFVINTVSADLDWPAYLATVAPGGTFCLVGVPASPMISLPAFALIGNEVRFVGGRTGAPSNIADMVNFAARHGVKPMIEVYPLAEANKALERTRRSQARYRAVLAVG